MLGTKIIPENGFDFVSEDMGSQKSSQKITVKLEKQKKKTLTESNLQHSCCRSQGPLCTNEKRWLIRIHAEEQTYAVMAKFILWWTGWCYHQYFNVHYRSTLHWGRKSMMLIHQERVTYLWNTFYIPSHSQCTLLYQGPASVLKHRNTETQQNNPECLSLALQPNQKICFTFTYVTGCWLADSILEFVVFPTFGTYVTICAQFAIGYAGQAGIVTPVRIESPGAVCPTATLVEETFLSIFIWWGRGRGRGGHGELVNIKSTLFSPFDEDAISHMELLPGNVFSKKIWTLLKVKINGDYMGWRKDERTCCCQLCESSVSSANYSINTHCRNHKWLTERRKMSCGLTSETVAITRKLRII